MEFTVNQIETPLPMPRTARNIQQTTLNHPLPPTPSTQATQQSSNLNKSTRYSQYLQLNQIRTRQPTLPTVPEKNVHFNLNQTTNIPAQVQTKKQQPTPPSTQQQQQQQQHSTENFVNFIPNQDFQQIKRTHSLNNRFIDTAFKVSNDSVFFTQKLGEYLREKCKYGGCENKPIHIQWKRAKDLHPASHFLLDRNNQPVNLNQVTESNYLDFFKTKDYEQGLLGEIFN